MQDLNVNNPLIPRDIYFHSPLEHYTAIGKHLHNILSHNAPPSESQLRKVSRLALSLLGASASFVSLIPSVYTADEFQPFPGAGILSSQAVVMNFGLFGAWGYYELFKIAFEKNGKENRSTLKEKAAVVMRAFAACLQGFTSRLPSAGLALYVAPGIPSEWRPFWAVLGVLGTAGPESLSMYRTMLSIERIKKDSSVPLETQAIFKQIRSNLCQIVDIAMQQGIPLNQTSRSLRFPLLSGNSTDDPHLQALIKELIGQNDEMLQDRLASTSCANTKKMGEKNQCGISNKPFCDSFACSKCATHKICYRLSIA